MGANKVSAAYTRWAGRVPPLSMVLLAYMSLVAKDKDEVGWFGAGHEALAQIALGRPLPITDSDLRAVRRAITPLLEKRAIWVDRAPAPGRTDRPTTVRYRLNLDDVSEARRRTECGSHIGRNPTSRRTVSVPTQDGFRPTEEPRGEKRSYKTEESSVDLRTAVTVVGAEDRFVGSVASRQSTRNLALQTLADELDLHGLEAERFIRALPKLRPTKAQMPYHYVLAASDANYLEALWQEYLDLEAGAA